MISLIVFTCLFPLLSFAAEHKVKVGSGGLAFDPDTVKAETGDTIIFEFYPKNHSVAQAAWDKPCVPLPGEGDMRPIYSGFFPVAEDKSESDKVFSMMVNNTDPIWLYCSQQGHCKSGQVMVINPK
jgi:plastocyanin